MSLGMSYSDYWDGECDMTIYYREMDEKKRNRENEMLWLQGFYFYEALVNASPVLNAFSSKHEPFPYRDAPIPLTSTQDKLNKERENKKKLKAGKEAMRRMMAGVNAKFEKGGDIDGN